jgi:cytochrome c
LKRPLATSAFFFTLFGAAVLIFSAKYQDRANPEFSVKLNQQDDQANVFLKTDFHPQEVGPASLSSKPPMAVRAANRLTDPPQGFQDNCALCHGDHAEGVETMGPPLSGMNSRPKRTKEDIVKLLENPRAYGLKDPMPESFPQLSEDEKQNIADWLTALNRNDATSLNR